MITNVLRHAVRPVARRLSAFARQEDGTIVPLMLVMFMLMLLTGGIAVDVMRFETKRVAVQNTLDRATLAAASMTQSLEPVDVVNDYFARSGLESSLEHVSVRRGANFRIVDAEATVVSKNLFMSMMDQPELAAMNVSQAEQRITNVEVALVLDVSGSMQVQPTRITNLKAAAKDFVDDVLGSDSENKISITMVPYNGHVNLGPQLFSKFNAVSTHSYANSHCLDLPSATLDAAYRTTAISRGSPLPQVPFADSWSSTNTANSYTSYTSTDYGTIYRDTSRNLFSNVWCNPVAGNIVRMHSNNRTTLKANIDGLVAIGATSIDLGMKWGTFLLDPSSQSITSEMAAAGQVPSYFASRPAPYTDEETTKIIVLMTDGSNFEQERFGDAYRAGLAAGTVTYSGVADPFQIWRSTSDNNYSVFHRSRVTSTNATSICNSRPYWVPHLGAWHSRPWGSSAPSSSACYSTSATIVHPNTVQQTWPQVWQTLRVQYVAWQFFGRPLGTSSTTRTGWNTAALGTFRQLEQISDMDNRLDDICETAKTNNIKIYGIAFEAPDAGKSAIRDCASQPLSTYYFEPTGSELGDAFASIASNLSQLRLTQ